MCLIVVKPKGSRLPKSKKLRQWFNSYPDGFGLAFAYKGRVRVLKGAMNIDGMFTLLDNMRSYLEGVSPKEVDVVIQFRAAFTGGVVPRFCHPFPITKDQADLDSLDVFTDCALAHNGIIFEYSEMSYDEATYSWSKPTGQINDAQEFIKDYLVDMGDALHSAPVQKLITQHTVSKFALLSVSKGIELLGSFVHDGGLWFSNDGYKLQANKATYSWKRSQAELLEDETYLSVLKSDITGGVCCDFCKTYHPVLYSLPDDVDSSVCVDCFSYFAGVSPKATDVAHWTTMMGTRSY